MQSVKKTRRKKRRVGEAPRPLQNSATATSSDSGICELVNVTGGNAYDLFENLHILLFASKKKKVTFL